MTLIKTIALNSGMPESSSRPMGETSVKNVQRNNVKHLDQCSNVVLSQPWQIMEAPVHDVKKVVNSDTSSSGGD